MTLLAPILIESLPTIIIYFLLLRNDIIPDKFAKRVEHKPEVSDMIVSVRNGSTKIQFIR